MERRVVINGSTEGYENAETKARELITVIDQLRALRREFKRLDQEKKIAEEALVVSLGHLAVIQSLAVQEVRTLEDENPKAALIASLLDLGTQSRDIFTVRDLELFIEGQRPETAIRMVVRDLTYNPETTTDLALGESLGYDFSIAYENDEAYWDQADQARQEAGEKPLPRRQRAAQVPTRDTVPVSE
jgi:hypothetical protein